MKRLVDLKLYSYLSESHLPNLNWTSLEDAFDILDDNNVSIISFTDFNLFKLSFYRNLLSKSKEYKNKFQIFPGIEILLDDAKNKFKALFIFDSNYTESEFEQLQTIINDFFADNSSIKLSGFLTKIKKFKSEMIIDLNNCEKIDLKEIKKVSEKINYIISDSENVWFDKILQEAKKNITRISFDETNNWQNYHSPKTYIDVNDNDQEITFDYLFNNLKYQD